MTDPPLFSVIIPVHNAAATLPDTLASLQAQSLGAWEGLIVDDGSDDGSAALIAQACARDPRLRLIAGDHQPRGTSAARNLGLAQARGRYVAFLDADDLWLPQKLARQAEVLQAGARIVFSSYQRIDPQGRALGVVRAAPRVGWQDALRGNPIGCLTAAYCRAQFATARFPQRSLHEDYAFWLELLRSGERAIGLPEVLACYRVRPGSRSANKLRSARAVWDILGAEGIGLARQVTGFAGYAARGLAQRLRG